MRTPSQWSVGSRLTYAIQIGQHWLAGYFAPHVIFNFNINYYRII